MKVNINGHSHQVEIECEGNDLHRVIAVAKRLWRDTVQPSAPTGPAFGFHAELRPARDLYGTDADGR
jgi:hypothetical protein